jgi:hypothetical protein
VEPAGRVAKMKLLGHGEEVAKVPQIDIHM